MSTGIISNRFANRCQWLFFRSPQSWANIAEPFPSSAPFEPAECDYVPRTDGCP